MDGRTDGHMDGQRDIRTDTPSYRDARTHLKTFKNFNKKEKIDSYVTHII